MATHLVIGDPHCTPKASNDRFLWAGKFAHDLKPNTIICMGDFASMDSLSSYDKGKKQFEGRRYKKDIDHAHDREYAFPYAERMPWGGSSYGTQIKNYPVQGLATLKEDDRKTNNKTNVR